MWGKRVTSNRDYEKLFLDAKKIEGFDTREVKDWYVYSDIKMNARDRFRGNPNVTLIGGSTWKINGDEAMTLDNFKFIFIKHIFMLFKERIANIIISLSK